MISSFYRKLLSSALLFIVFCGCSKDNADAASILMQKAWSPYEVDIHSVDSNTVTVTNKSSGVQTVTKTVITKDTSYLVSDCQQNSVYQFKGNAVQTIADACNSGSADYNGNWQITQTQEFTFTQFVLVGSFVSGFLTEINDSRFIFKTVGNYYSFGTSIDANGNNVETDDAITYMTSLIFKSK